MEAMPTSSGGGGGGSGGGGGGGGKILIIEKGSRNKRKFRADPPSGETTKNPSSLWSECPSYERSAEKSQTALTQEHHGVCDLCSNQDHADALKHDLKLLSLQGSSGVGPSRPREEPEGDEFLEADWNDLSEIQLEEIALSNVKTIFKGAIKKIVACGYTEEVAIKAVLRSGLYYGCKDTVSNIVDNTLAFLRNGQDINAPREQIFEDLDQLEQYVLAEMICVVKEVRPFLSTGDAMWCLLISDMNVSHACAMEGSPLRGFGGDQAPGGSGNSSVPNISQLKSEANITELSLSTSSKPNPSFSCAHGSQSATPTVFGIPNLPNPKNPPVLEGLPPEKSLGVTGEHVQASSQSSALEEKSGGGKKGHSGSAKRDSIPRQQSLHLEKSSRAYGTKGALKTGKLSGFGGLVLDKKVKPASDATTSVNLKSSSLKISKGVGTDVNQGDGNPILSAITGFSTPSAFNLKAVNPLSALPTANIPSTLPTASTQSALPTSISQSTLPATNTELSLSLPTKSKPLNRNPDGRSSTYYRIPLDKILGRGVPQEKKDEVIQKLLVPRVQELENQLQEWTEWANQKVMQATRRLSKEKVELKTLRQEKEEATSAKKEKQALEENTMKKLSEMENALCKASNQVEWANSTFRKLEVENGDLRKQMETAKLRAVESAANCHEVAKREEKTMKKFNSWEKQKTMLQEDLAAEKHKRSQLEQEVEKAKALKEHFEAKCRQEEKAKEEILARVSSIKKEREQIEASGKEQEDMIKLKTEKDLHKYKVDIQKLENKISQLRVKSDSSKIAALRRGIDGRNVSSPTAIPAPSFSETAMGFPDCSGTGGVKRERECVMCLSEERSVVFLPCAHQVVCVKCNELHEKQGMKDCPSCRTPIQMRICARFARS